MTGAARSPNLAEASGSAIVYADTLPWRKSVNRASECLESSALQPSIVGDASKRNMAGHVVRSTPTKAPTGSAMQIITKSSSVFECAFEMDKMPSCIVLVYDYRGSVPGWKGICNSGRLAYQ